MTPWRHAMWARRSDFAWRPPTWLAVVSVALAAVVHVIVAWSARFPAIPLDEIIMVGNSRVIAGEGGEWALSGGGFMPGLAFLMAPAWWFTDSALTVYHVGLGITIALSLLAIWPLSAIAKRTGISRNAGVIVSAIVVMAPARALLSNYLLAESAFLVATAALVVAADRLWARRTDADALWFGAATGATVLAHGRGVGTAVAAGLWTLLLLRHDVRRAILAGTSAAVLSVGAYALYRVVTASVIDDDPRIANALGSGTVRELGALAASAVGQLWYATLAWPAVAVLGAMAVFAWCRRSGMASFALMAVPVGLIVSTVQLNPHAGMVRMDPWFYGRYMDTWWSILAVIGLAVLVRVKWPTLSALALVATTVCGAAMLAFTVRVMPRDMSWADVHVLGITPWLRLDTYARGRDQSWNVIVLTGLALTLLILALGIVRVWVLPTLAGLWIWLSLAQDIQGIDIRLGDRGPIGDGLGITLLPEGATIGVDSESGVFGNFIVFGAESNPVVKVDPLDPPDGVDVVYVLWLKSESTPPGVKILGQTLGSRLVGWVYPGELADSLDAQGLLVDSEYATASG